MNFVVVGTDHRMQRSETRFEGLLRGLLAMPICVLAPLHPSVRHSWPSRALDERGLTIFASCHQSFRGSPHTLVHDPHRVGLSTARNRSPIEGRRQQNPLHTNRYLHFAKLPTRWRKNGEFARIPLLPTGRRIISPIVRIRFLPAD